MPRFDANLKKNAIISKLSFKNFTHAVDAGFSGLRYSGKPQFKGHLLAILGTNFDCLQTSP